MIRQSGTELTVIEYRKTPREAQGPDRNAR